MRARGLSYELTGCDVSIREYFYQFDSLYGIDVPSPAAVERAEERSLWTHGWLVSPRLRSPGSAGAPSPFPQPGGRGPADAALHIPA